MTIGVWGDSITFGACDSEALGWAGRIRKSLPEDDEGHELYNFGICGETSGDILKRFNVEAEAVKSTHIIFAVGINDSKYPNDSSENLVPVDQYEKNLAELIVQAKKYTAEIVIIGATRVDDEWRSARGSRFLNEQIQEYNTTMQRIASENGLKFIDMFQMLDPAADLDDGLHPNSQGYQKMFEVIRPELEEWF